MIKIKYKKLVRIGFAAVGILCVTIAIKVFASGKTKGVLMVTTHPIVPQSFSSQSTYGLSAAPSGGSFHTKNAQDQIGTMTLSVDSAGPIAINKITVTFSGSLVTSSLLDTASLTDQSGNDVTDADAAVVTTSSSTNSVAWTFGAGPDGFAISAGASSTFTLQVSSDVVAGQAGVAQSLSASIQNADDVQFTDGLDTTAAQNISVPPSVVPVLINSISYPIGQ